MRRRLLRIVVSPDLASPRARNSQMEQARYAGYRGRAVRQMRGPGRSLTANVLIESALFGARSD
jgi:hypothetical protein